QSPKWKPVVQRWLAPARRRIHSTHARMLAYCYESNRRSPYARYMFHGMITAASDHPAEPAPFNESPPRTFGMTYGTGPAGLWSAARSRSHLEKNPATFRLN